MQFRTPVDIPAAPFQIYPKDRLLFVGSCFAQNIGQRFIDNQFRTMVNPYGTMYNPASIEHTLERYLKENPAPDVTILTLGTNHVYILKENGKIVDNCEKRPQSLFHEKELTVEHCANYLSACLNILREANKHTRIIFTVSPIRYAKYGFHGSQLSKATLLLAIEKIRENLADASDIAYFPTYEIVCDELRDYRFYAADMLHPSEQATDYIYERFAETFFAPETHRFVEEWQPIRRALSHKPFNAESPEYQRFHEQTLQQADKFRQRYGLSV